MGGKDILAIYKGLKTRKNRSLEIMECVLGMLRDESVSSKHWSGHRNSFMPFLESHAGLGLEHSDPEILKKVQCTVVCPKDPFFTKYSRRF